MKRKDWTPLFVATCLGIVLAVTSKGRPGWALGATWAFWGLVTGASAMIAFDAKRGSHAN